MRSVLTFTLIIFLSLPSFGQDKTVDFSKVDKFALQTPDSVTTDIAQLADYLTGTAATPSSEKKVRAIFVWVSQNIRRVKDVRDELKEGQQVLVKVIAIDPTGKIRLSRKALLTPEDGAPAV